MLHGARTTAACGSNVAEATDLEKIRNGEEPSILAIHARLQTPPNDNRDLHLMFMIIGSYKIKNNTIW